MKFIPEPSRKRLVVLAQLLSQQTKVKITSEELEELSGWSQSVIRRDISLLELHFGAKGGYPVEQLRSSICALLNISEESSAEKKCCIVGLGHLGAALLQDSLFEPFKIVAGFDSNVNRTEVLRSSFPLHPTSELERVIRSEGIQFAILTVSNESAQATAEQLVKCGIRGIVNYTACVLSLPPQIACENVSPVRALTSLSSRIQ